MAGSSLDTRGMGIVLSAHPELRLNREISTESDLTRGEKEIG
jgi:hypothetical protein